MIVSANRASCTPAEPITAGPSVLKKRRMARIEARRFSIIGTAFSRLAASHTSSNSRTPAKATPHAAGMAGGGKQERQAERGDERDVEQNRRCGGRGETLMGVEDRREDRHQGDEQEIREGDARQRHREVELRRIG